MIPVSLVVVVVGGWTAVYLTDLVLKVRASGLRPKPVVLRVRARDPRSFPLPCASRNGSRAAGVHLRPSAWRAVRWSK